MESLSSESSGTSSPRRESNPQRLLTEEAARPSDMGKLVECRGIQPRSLQCESSVFALDEHPVAGLEGVEPSSAVLEAALHPMHRPRKSAPRTEIESVSRRV